MTVAEVKTYLIECDRATHRKCMSRPRTGTYMIQASTTEILRRSLEGHGWLVDDDMTSTICLRCR